jgi:hypothetical protein
VSHFVFPDNTVLCNFAAVGRLDLLEAVLLGRGRWTEAVAYEASRSASALPDLAAIAKEGWLGEPIEIEDEAEVRQIERVRRSVFGGEDAAPLKHLGEAQTCQILQRWPDFAGSWWVSDDREALRYARQQHLTTYETIDLVCVAAVNGDVTAQAGHDLLHAMDEKGRTLRLSKSPQELLK